MSYEGKWLVFLFLLFSVDELHRVIRGDAKVINCTPEGNHCLPNPNLTHHLRNTIDKPCYKKREFVRDPCMINKKKSNKACDYCIENSNGQRSSCRDEDGFYHFKHKSTDYCVRRSQFATRKDYEKKFEAVIPCSDDEMAFELKESDKQYKCIKRYDINTWFDNNWVKSRKILIRCHTENEFQCPKSKRCIPRSWVRDGSNDCNFNNFGIEDLGDEEKPLYECNNQSEFRCLDEMKRCISREQVMDGHQDCFNNSDEKSPLTNCNNQTEFRCHENGRCIKRYRVNDAFPDCLTGSDEKLTNFSCDLEREFDCGNGRCIPRSWVKNSIQDCPNGRDELVSLSNCTKNEFACKDNSRCLPLKYQCDGVSNCPDCSDEIEYCKEPMMFRCKNGRNSLNTSRCIPWSFTCNEVAECSDESDEDTSEHLGFKCLFQIKGKSGKKKRGSKETSLIVKEKCFVPQYALKDHFKDCPDYSDQCYNSKGEFVCARCLDENKTIITKSQICDGIVDCPDASDECPCETSKVEPLCERLMGGGNSSCSLDKMGKTFHLCNNIEECDKGVDEMFCYGIGDKFKKISTKYRQAFNNLRRLKLKSKKKESVIKKTYQCKTYGLNETMKAKAKGIKDAKFCDRVVNCPLGDDECAKECPYIGKLYFRKRCNVSAGVCVVEDSRYKSGELMVKAEVRDLCDGVSLCKDNSDEKGCNWRYKCETNTTRNLLRKVWKKDNGKKKLKNKFKLMLEKPLNTIDIGSLCDLKADCLDSSDEMNCPEETHFYCESGHPLFIPRKSKYYDGVPDCSDSSDECPKDLYEQDFFTSPTELIKNIALRCIIWITSSMSLIGNSCVIVFISRKLYKLGDTNSTTYFNSLLVCHLAIADLLMGVSLFILAIKAQQFSGSYCLHDLMWRSSNLCNMIGALSIISTQCSINILIILTAIRLFKTIKPFSDEYITRNLLRFLCFLSWIIAVLFGLFPIIVKETFLQGFLIQSNPYFTGQIVAREQLKAYEVRSKQLLHLTSNSQYFRNESSKLLYPNRYLNIRGRFGYYSSYAVCVPDLYSSYYPEYALSASIITYNFVGIIFIMASYLIIYRKATSFSASSVKQISNVHEQRAVTLRRRVTYLVITNLLCWLPIITLAFVSYKGAKLPPFVHAFSSIVLLPINSSINPILYARVHIKLIKIFRRRILRSVPPKSKPTRETNLSVTVRETTTFVKE